jgi:hypothetical protein
LADGSKTSLGHFLATYQGYLYILRGR